VMDVQDMWPDTLKATGMATNGFVLQLTGLCCQWLYKAVDHIVVLSPGFQKLLASRGVPKDKISIIYNWADETALELRKHTTPTEMADPKMFRVLFAGNMGKAQALDNVLDAAQIVAERRKNVEFVFLGGGLKVNCLKNKAAEARLTNVKFLPAVPMAEVGNYLAAADCLLVHLRSDPLFAVTIPSKTQAYMAAGKPIIIAVEGNAAELVKQSKGGIDVPTNDPRALSEAVLYMAGLPKDELTKMGCAAKDFYEKNLSLERGAEAFVNLFRKILGMKM